MQFRFKFWTIASGLLLFVALVSGFFQSCGAPNQFDTQDLAAFDGSSNTMAFNQPVGNFITNLNQGLIGQAPSAANLAAWTAAISQGQGCTSFANAFLSGSLTGTPTPNYPTYEQSLSASAAVTGLYQGLLGRSPTSDELSNGIPMVQESVVTGGSVTGTVTDTSSLATNIVQSSEFQSYCTHFTGLNP